MSISSKSIAGEKSSPGPEFEFSIIVGVLSDYVYRGVSLTGEDPTGAAYLYAKYGPLYFSGLLVGNDLGRDGLGRSIGTLEADGTIGFAPSLGPVDLNIGAKYTGYPNGRDLVVGTTIARERDFIEFFAGGKVKLGSAVSVGGTAYWTPDFYYETGEVRTLELETAVDLPVVLGIYSRLTAAFGDVRSQQLNIVSPGDGYTYHHIGIEGQFEKLVFDLRYWNTDVENFDVFDQRVTVGLGVKLP